jgi:hypothetical protein
MELYDQPAEVAEIVAVIVLNRLSQCGGVKSRPREMRGHFAASPHRSKRAIGTIYIEVSARVGARANDQLDAQMHRHELRDLCYSCRNELR